MSGDVAFLTFLYIIFCLGLIYPPREFVVGGLTIENVFSHFLGSEVIDFVRYHIKRTLFTLLVFATLPLGYIILLWLLFYLQELPLEDLYQHSLLHIFLAISLIIVSLALYYIKKWSDNEFRDHPIAVNLSRFCNSNSSWLSVASDINAEYRANKFSVQTSAIHRVVATTNWIMKINPLNINFAHQSDARLVVDQSDTHSINESSAGGVQFLNILISQSGRQSVPDFHIRLNVNDFKDLQNQVTRTIAVLPEIKFHKSIADKFADAFKDVIALNPKYVTEQELDTCIGCMQVPANVKLQKLCESSGTDSCVTCYCRPMWCADCLAKWFAYRQDQDSPNSWFSSKCSCPMCRAQFCLLDVCLVQEQE